MKTMIALDFSLNAFKRVKWHKPQIVGNLNEILSLLVMFWIEMFIFPLVT